MTRSRIFILLYLLIHFTFHDAVAQQLVRKEINIPDIPGYFTLKCDFHMHTVFSDGYVWPNVRIDEAFRDGLDAISVTDHLEYHPHRTYVDTGDNRAYELLKDYAHKKNMLLIHGTEITRDMPPGHFNALFIKDANLLDHNDDLKVLEQACEQDGYIFWNHPGWKPQAQDGIKWYDMHDTILGNGWMHGIEVYNFDEWYPEALGWCIEKDLAVLCNSDVHHTIDMYMDKYAFTHRPLTLVFAKERSVEAIREALFAGNTAGYFEDTLVGKPELLEAVFYSSVELKSSFFEESGWYYYEIHNASDVNYLLVKDDPDLNGIPGEIRIPAHGTTIIKINKDESDAISAGYQVKNCFVGANRENLTVYLRFK